MCRTPRAGPQSRTRQSSTLQGVPRLYVPLIFFFLMIRPPPRSPLFPYTTLFRSLLEAKIRRSPFKRWTARELLGRCAVVVAISRWTAELARSVLGQLDCPALAADVRVVQIGRAHV